MMKTKSVEDAHSKSAPGAPGGLPRTLFWDGGRDGALHLLDQTLLPHLVKYRVCTTAEHVWQAIRELCVRGAPAIGVAAAYGLCLGTRPFLDRDPGGFGEKAREVGEYLDSARPTAVNLAWAIRRMLGVLAEAHGATVADLWDTLFAEARVIEHEDAETCRLIGQHGQHLIPEGGGVLTHCNAGALATVAHGTALSPMYAAHAAGRSFRVFADETRPLLQGARLTAFELSAAGIDVTVLCDGAAAALMSRGTVQLVIVGADRIAANGDVANKIGTFALALCARHHDIPFYVAAPRSTFDLTLACGAEIPIEERSASEVRGGFGTDQVAPGAGCFNPAFDVTPAGLVSGIVTEAGLVKPVTVENIRGIFARGGCKGP